MKPEVDVLLVGDATSQHLERLTRALMDAGVRLAIAGFERGNSKVVHYRLGSLPPTADGRYGAAIPGLRRLIRAVRPRIVHAHYLSSYGLLAAIVVRSLTPAVRPRLIQSLWGTDVLVTASSGPRRLMAAFALRAADLVTGDSTELHDDAVQIAGRDLNWHPFVFGPPADLFSQQRTPDALIVSSRRLIEEMRVARIAEAFLYARRSFPALVPFRLAICGDGPRREELRRDFSDAAVEFRGVLTETELHGLLLSSRAFVSIPATDGTSASLLEAMAAGSTPIVNALPANLEWVTPAVGGIVSRDPTVLELAESMAATVSRSIDHAQIRAAVRWVTWESEVASLISTYNNQVNRQE